MGHRIRPRNPALYHGKEGSCRYFEGWYFKHTSDDETLCVIPGVFLGPGKDSGEAFIQVMYGHPPICHYIRYPKNSFKISSDRFDLHIGRSFFTMDRVVLDIDTPRIQAELKYSRHIPLETHFLSPSIMGPFSYFPAMQCNHGILSLKHAVNGSALIDGHTIVYRDADGYIEKDWGEAFPKSWIWMQCNDKTASLMCAAATIPYGPLHFDGLICVLLADGKQNRFATYNGARVDRLSLHGAFVTAVIRRRHYRLHIHAEANAFGTLKAPSEKGMTRDIQESINASYQIALYYKGGLIFSRNIKNGGLELLDAAALAMKRAEPVRYEK